METDSRRYNIARLPDARWEDYRSLRLEAMKNEPSAFLSTFEDEISHEDYFWKDRMKNLFFAVDEDNRIVGFVGARHRSRKKTRHVAEIFSFYVTPEFRRSGVGKGLLTSAISSVSQNEEVRKVSLSVCSEQDSAVRLYIDSGFEIVGRLKDEMRLGDRYLDFFIMEKFL